jgi:hypothetical protein
MRSPDDYLVPLAPTRDVTRVRRAADDALRRVARTSFAQPGFALIAAEQSYSPTEFRRVLAEVIAAVGAAYNAQFARRLVLCSMGRFDQQVSTEAHLDGAPQESILMLGYEPTEVESEIELYDYSEAAADFGLEPGTFLDRFNPTFGAGRAALAPYRTAIRAFDHRRFNILLINNSSAELAGGAAAGMLGVLHRSIIFRRRPEATRYVNTIMLTPVGRGTAVRGCTPIEVDEYVEAGSFRTCC